jgi:NADH-quinone oxidoreductase subunit J
MFAPPAVPPVPPEIANDLKPLEIAFFGICALLCLVGGIVTVGAKNPIRGAMGLLGTIIGIAGMYLMLSAELLAAIQVVVYAGAVVILFLFVIMLLGPSASPSSDARGALSRYFGAGVFLIAAAGVLWSVMHFGGQALTKMPPPPPGLGTIELIGRELFSRDVVPFQIAGVLLLISVVGAVAVARGRGADDIHAIAKKAGAPLLPQQTRLEVTGVPALSSALRRDDGRAAVAATDERPAGNVTGATVEARGSKEAHT